MYNQRIKMNKKIIKSPIYVFKKTWPMLIILTQKYGKIIKNNYKRLRIIQINYKFVKIQIKNPNNNFIKSSRIMIIR